eukprot:1156271-Pelagomonas_calceolata.AAC.7
MLFDFNHAVATPSYHGSQHLEYPENGLMIRHSPLLATQAKVPFCVQHPRLKLLQSAAQEKRQCQLLCQMT